MRILDVITFSLREAIRARFFVAVFLFSLMAVFAGAVLGGVPWGDVDQVILNLGWGAISLMSLLLGVLYTSQVIQRDKDKRILYMLLARPVSRISYLLGKFLSVVILLGFSIGVMALVLFGCVHVYGIRPHGAFEFVWPALWIWAKAISIVGYAAAFSILFSYLPSLFYTISVYVVGSSIGTAIAFLEQKDDAGMLPIIEALYWLFPNYELLDLVNRIVHDMAVPSQRDLGAACLYFVGYGLFAIGIAAVIFERRDLE